MEDAPYLRSPPHALSPARAGMFLRKAAATCSRPPPLSLVHKGWLALGCAVAAILLFAAFDFFGRGVLIGGLVIAAITAWLGTRTTFPTPAGAEALRQWKGFYRFLRDFTLASEREPGEVALWGEYLT